MKPPFLATQFNIEPNEWSDKTGLECKDKSLAQQQFKDECDINILFGRYLETGEMPQVMNNGLSYQHFEGIFDYMSAANAVRRAEEAFATLPARIKNRFENNPDKLINFLENKDNREEAQFLGLVAKPANSGPEHAATTPSNADRAEPGPTSDVAARDTQTGKTKG